MISQEARRHANAAPAPAPTLTAVSAPRRPAWPTQRTQADRIPSTARTAPPPDSVEPRPGPSRVRHVRRALGFNAGIASAVWICWLLVGQNHAIESLRRHWSVTVTMVFGSLVGGGTSEGGGGVAFPVFTKVLHIPAGDARIFTYAVQSVGMTAASLTILYMRVPIERRFLLLAAPAGVVGVVSGTTLLASSMQPATIRIGFTTLLTSLALALLILHLRRIDDRNERLTLFGGREKAVIAAVGFAGGLVSAMVGVGENTVAFFVMVMLFRISEKIATPTTVILMAIVSLAASCTHAFVLHDLAGPIPGYWLAAVPVVVVGAPAGAVICSKMSRRTIRLILITLIAADLASTAVLVPIPAPTLACCLGFLGAAAIGCRLMTRVDRYRPAPPTDAGSATPTGTALII